MQRSKKWKGERVRVVRVVRVVVTKAEWLNEEEIGTGRLGSHVM
jgi:hypothetical protein